MDERERVAIARMKRGDIGGLEPLVRAYQVAAIRTAYLIARDRALAEDIVQSAFIRAFERIHQFDDARPFGPWFLRSVANDAAKAATRNRRVVRFDAADDEPSGTARQIADDALGPEQLLEGAETRDQLWAALAELPPGQREAVVLRYYLELSEAETAGRMGIPAGTVKWRLHAARKRLSALAGALRPGTGAAPGTEAERRPESESRP